MSQAKPSDVFTNIHIFDTTLRDGDQGTGTPFMLPEKILVAQALTRTWVEIIEAGFARSRIDMDSIKAVVDHIGKWENAPIIASLSRANKEDINASFEALQWASKPRIHTFIATSPIHMKEKLHMTPSKVLQKIRESVSYAVSTGMEVQWSAEDAMNSEKAFLLKAVRTAIISGAKILNIPDTLGGSNPWRTESIFRFLHDKTADLHAQGYDFIFSSHTHNDNGLALANTIAAIRWGARQVETTVLGIGERAGNVALHQVTAYLQEFGGEIAENQVFNTQMRTWEIFPLSSMVAKIIGTSIHGNEPIIGSRTNRHGSGIHADGALKWQEKSGRDIYSIIDSSKYGNPGEPNTFNARSGVAEIKSMLAPFIDVETIATEIIDEVVRKSATMAEKARGIYETMVYAIYLETAGQFAIENIKITAGNQVEITLFLQWKTIILSGIGNAENGIIAATIAAINSYIGNETLDIQSFHAENRATVDELAKTYFHEETPRIHGSEEIGIVSFELRKENGEIIHTRHASYSVDESIVKAIVYGSIHFFK